MCRYAGGRMILEIEDIAGNAEFRRVVVPAGLNLGLNGNLSGLGAAPQFMQNVPGL
jgi:hypothetical protein